MTPKQTFDKITLIRKYAREIEDICNDAHEKLQESQPEVAEYFLTAMRELFPIYQNCEKINQCVLRDTWKRTKQNLEMNRAVEAFEKVAKTLQKN